ncbi:MAG: hypothetical protein ACYTFE_05535 [Planctomycetota bacterium]|jgi:hypothetical protein
MNKRQKKIIRDILTVLIVTIMAVVAMINFKDWVNRSEATRAMERLGQIVMKYRQDYGAVPGQSFVDRIKDDLPGRERIGGLVYRAQWIGFESEPEDILAYTKRAALSPFLEDGYVVLRLSGEVEWIKEDDFLVLLAQQQTHDELEMIKSSMEK